MSTGKIAVLSLSVLAISAGVFVVGLPLVSEAQAATNQPEMEVESVSLSESEIEAGDSVEVTTVVENEGAVGGELTATLEADGEQRGSETVELAPEEEQTVSFVEEFDDAGTYEITVNGEQERELRVLEPGELSITSSSTYNMIILPGQSLNYFIAVQNVGDTIGLFTVELTANGRTVSDKELRVPGGYSRTFRPTFAPDQPGTYDMQIETADDVDDGGVVRVAEPPEPEFEVSDASVSDERIEAGEQTRITAAVENVGGAAGTYEADLLVDGNAVTSTQVRLDSGESTTVEFQRTFSDPGEYTVDIDDERAGTVSVLAPADLSVTEARSSNGRVQTGETVRITATVANAGDVAGETTVSLEIDGRVVENAGVEVAGGESKKVTFTRQFETRGDRSVAVDDVSAGTVSVLAPPNVVVTGAEMSKDEVLVGEPLSVQVSVENTGDSSGATTVALAVDGTVVDSTEVTVDGQEAETVEFTRAFEEVGAKTLRINGVSIGQVSVLAPATFEITSTGVSNETVMTTDTVLTTAAVRNTGDVEGTYDAALQVDGQQAQSTAVTLDSGESTTVSFEHQFESPGEYTLRVGNATAGTVSALLPADLSVVRADTVSDEITTDQSLAVEATVENSGDVSGEMPLRLAIDGNTVDQKPVSLDGGERNTVNFSYQFDSTGEKRVTVNGSLAGEVVVLAPAEFDISDGSLARQSILAGESMTVSAQVENIGDVDGEFDALLFVQGERVGANSLTLDAGESQQVTFREAFPEPGTYAVEISGARAGEVVVERPPTLRVTSTTINETTILENGTARINARIGNTGDRRGTFTVDLQVDGEVVAQQTTSIPAGNTTSVSFARRFPNDGEYELSVADATVETIRVEQPAAFELTDAAVNSSAVLAGNPVEIVATVANDGDRSGTYDIGVAVEGEAVDTYPVTVSGQRTKTVRISHTFEAPGEYSIALNEETAGTVDVSEPPEIEVNRAVVSADWVAQGETTKVRTAVENPGEWTTTRTVTVTVDGDEVAARSVTLEPGEQREVEIEIGAKNGPIEVNGVEAGRIESSELNERSQADGQTQAGGIDFYPILTLVLVLGVVIVGWFALSLFGVINWRG
jgi:hypothetical protein